MQHRAVWAGKLQSQEGVPLCSCALRSQCSPDRGSSALMYSLYDGTDLFACISGEYEALEAKKGHHTLGFGAERGVPCPAIPTPFLSSLFTAWAFSKEKRLPIPLQTNSLSSGPLKVVSRLVLDQVLYVLAWRASLGPHFFASGAVHLFLVTFPPFLCSFPALLLRGIQ